MKVLTDADLIKESRESSKNMVDKMESSTKRSSASGYQKSKQGQITKAKENSRRKTNLSSQINVRNSKCEANLKRKSSNQDSCSRSRKRRPDSVKVVGKGVQKQTQTKKPKADFKDPLKTEVKMESKWSLGSKNLAAKGVSSTQFKLLLTNSCSVPVVPVEVMSSSGQRQLGAVLSFNKLDPPLCTVTKRMTSSNDKELLTSLPDDQNVHDNVDKTDQNQSKQSDAEVNPTSRRIENSNEIATRSEGTVEGEGEETCVSNILHDQYVRLSPSQEQDIERQDSNKITQTEEVVEALDDFDGERNNNESVASEEQQNTGTQEAQLVNVPLKRSARISERREYILHSQPKSAKLGHKKSSVESNVLEEVESVFGQDNAVLKSSGSLISNQPTEGSTPTNQNSHKQKNSASSTKYTQRMTWKLQPQMTPADNINPVSVGDIVWGKVHGHPWWPGRVLAISGIRNEESNNPWDRDAHVSWFGSNTSSIMHIHSLQLFLPNFAKRHKKQKKGYYRVAVRQAQEALMALNGTD